MNHFLSLTCLSWLRSWYLTAPAVIAGMERDLPGGVDPGEPVGIEGFVFDESGDLPPADALARLLDI